MKFLYKILLWTIIIMATAFGLSGYFFVNYVFQTALEREVGQAMDDSNILQFAFETAALNIPTRYDVLQDIAVQQIGANLENSGQDSGRLLRLSNEEKETLYVSDGFTEDTSLLQDISENTIIWQVFQQGDHYYIQTGIMVNALDRNLYLETMEDVTSVFDERAMGFTVYRRVTLIMLLACAVVMFFICTWLTKPIRLLAGATRRMAGGDYSYRARQISTDELGQLTQDFNRMANVLEETIGELQEEVRAREDFIAAFAHELKTPLTAIIGYADLLRSRKLDEEKHFLSSNYIYTEGKRLENMSFRLLDIIVTKREQIDPQPVEAEVFEKYLVDMFAGNTEQTLDTWFEPGTVYTEANLMKSVLLNLVDNAFKASAQGGVVEITGWNTERGYAFQVKDYGVGIPEEELKKVTEAFYMVDKSRSRSKNGAGLGLALCVEILRLHQSELFIDSELGVGTSICFELPNVTVSSEAAGAAETAAETEDIVGTGDASDVVDADQGEDASDVVDSAKAGNAIGSADISAAVGSDSAKISSADAGDIVEAAE